MTTKLSNSEIMIYNGKEINFYHDSPFKTVVVVKNYHTQKAELYASKEYVNPFSLENTKPLRVWDIKRYDELVMNAVGIAPIGGTKRVSQLHEFKQSSNISYPWNQNI